MASRDDERRRVLTLGVAMGEGGGWLAPPAVSRGRNGTEVGTGEGIVGGMFGTAGTTLMELR